MNLLYIVWIFFFPLIHPNFITTPVIVNTGICELPHNMPVLPNLTRRKADVPAASSESSTSANFSTVIVAGSIICFFFLLFMTFWLVNTGIPWCKRTRDARNIRKNAVTDQEAVIDQVPGPFVQPTKELELREIPPMNSEDEKLSHEDTQSTVDGSSDTFSSKMFGNNVPANDTTLKETGNQPALPVGIGHEHVRDSFDLSYDNVRDSGISTSTVNTCATSVGTTLSYGVAVPMRMILQKTVMC